MQYILAFIILIVLVALIIYKINDKFEKKEFFIFLVILVVSIGGFMLYENYSKNKLPKLFEEKYFQSKNIKIQKLSFELLNNKNISSTKNFEYKFVYIIKKDDKEFLCTAPKVVINKISDEYIFSSLKNLDEKCEEQ